MGLMEQPLIEPGRLIITPHPLLVDGQRNVAWELRAGESLYALLMRNVAELDGQRWEVTIGGLPVERHLWHKVRPKHGQVIEVRGGVGKAALAIVAIAVLSYFTLGLGGMAAGSFLGLTGAAGYVAATAVYMAGSMLINKVLMPKPPKADNRQADSVYSISGARNQMRQYEPLPLLFGRIRITPDLLSAPYSWYEGNDQYLGMVLCTGINVGRVDSLLNGETPLANYEGVQVYHAGYSQMAEQSIPLYSNADLVDGAELPKDHGWVERTTSVDTLRVQIGLEYVLGGTGTSGKSYPVSERIEVQYRAVGTSDWKVLANETYRSDRFDVRRATIARDVALGQYELRVRKVGLADYEGKNTQKNDFQWTTLTSVQQDRADYTGIARTGLRIKATGQLNGSPDEIRCIAAADPIPEWNGSEWVVRESSNPGAQCLAYARGIRRGGRLLGGMTLSDSQIDLESWKAFSLHCAANGYTYDHYVKETRSHSDILSSIARAGFGEITWAGGRLGVIWAAQEQPLSGVVNMATIKKGQFQVDYSLVSAADGIEYTYIDPADWQAKTLRVPAPGIETMLNPAQVSGEGVTSEQHAARLARWHLAQSLYQYKDIAYSTDIEHLSYQRLSVLALQHDMTQWGFGGRVAAVERVGAEVILTLDEPVPGQSGSSSFIGLRIPGERVYRVLKVKAFSGDSRVLTLAEPWPADAELPGSHAGNPAHDTIWVYDFKQTPGYRVRVTSIEPEDGLKGAAVRVVPEGPEFWNYVLTGHYVPPANGSSLQTRPVASNLRVTEHQVTQGDTVFTELTATFDISGPVGNVVVRAAGAEGELQDVAQTTTRTATWRIPGPGRYTVVARPYSPDGMAGTAVQGTYTTTGAGLAPVLVDLFDVEERSGGVRLYTWGWLEGTMRSPDFAGVEIRHVAGQVAAPDWDAMIPVGQSGFHTAPFEAVMPESGQWTFACRSRNTSGVLSQEMRVVRRNLQANLGQVIGGIESGLGEQGRNLAKEISDRMDADLAEAAARAEGLSHAAKALADEVAARAQADAAALQSIATESAARVAGLLNEKLAREAAISQEQTTRKNDVESLSRALSEVAAGSGTQFDSATIWYFDKTLDGWTGNGAPTVVDGWLRPANASASPWVQSPAALAVDGSAYRFLKLRVKRMGAPAWAGKLQWISASDRTWNAQKSVVIAEPKWDSNGVATLDLQDVAWWPGVVDAIRLQLGVAQTASDGFLLDWVAIGRPTPGASVALVQQESQARTAGDAAEASQRNTLAVQLRGSYTGSDLSQVAQGFIADERTARVAADSAQVSRISAMEVRMPAGSGQVATQASVTAEQQARVAADEAAASTLQQVKSQLPALVAQGSNLVLNGSWEHGADVGWSYSGSAVSTPATEGRGGGRCLRVDGGSGVRFAHANGKQPTAVTPGRKYRYSCWYRTSADYNGTAGNGKMRLSTQTDALIGGATFFQQNKTAWTYLEGVYEVALNSSITGLLLQFCSDNTAGSLWIDDASLEEVTEVLALADGQQGLSTRVTNAEGKIESQSQSITALTNRVGGVENGNAVNTTAITGLTGRVTTAEGKIDAASSNVTRLQAEMKASLAGGAGMFPSGSFEQFQDGQLISAGYGTTFTVNGTGRRNGNRGLDILVGSDTRPDLNADCYPMSEFVPLAGARRLYVEAFVALTNDSVDIPADNSSYLRIGVQTSQAGGGGAGLVWTTLTWGIKSLSKTSWTKVSGYVTTNASAAQARLFISLPGHATDPKSQRVVGSRFRLDDIVVTDVTEAYAAQQAADAAATAVQGLTTRVGSAEGKIEAQAQQLVDLGSSIGSVGGDNLLPNSSFELSASDRVAPTGWNLEGNGPSVSASYVPSPLSGGGRALRLEATTTANNQWFGLTYTNGGNVQDLVKIKPATDYVLSSHVRGSAGCTAQIIIQWRDASNATVATTALPPAAMDGTWQRLLLPARTTAPTAVAARVYVGRLTVPTPQGAAIEIDNAKFQEGKVATAWSPSGQEAAAGILANAAATAGLTTTVSQQGNKLDAAAQDLVNLKTQVGDVTATGFNQLKTQVTQQGQAQTAQAQQINGLQAQVGGKADASVVQSMEVRVANGGAGGNLLMNSTFPMWNPSGWFWAGNDGWSALGNPTGDESWRPLGVYGIGAVRGRGAWAVGATSWMQTEYVVPVVAGTTYCASAYINTHRCKAVVNIIWYDKANNRIGNAATEWMGPFGIGPVPLLSDLPRPYVIAKAPANAAYMRFEFGVMATGESDPYFWFFRPMFARVNDGANTPPAWSAGGEEASSRWAVNVRADGRVGGIELSSNGQVSAFDVVADRFRVSNPGNGGMRTEYSDGNWRVYDGNGRLRVAMGINI